MNTSIAGAVRTAVLPANVWQQVATAGDCRLIVGPTLVCNPACTNPQICAGQNQCIDEPRFRGVGDVTVTGLGSAPVAVAYAATNSTYYAYLATPYPPAAAGASITLTAAGGDLPGFTLAGRGIAELQFDTAPSRDARPGGDGDLGGAGSTGRHPHPGVAGHRPPRRRRGPRRMRLRRRRIR